MTTNTTPSDVADEFDIQLADAEIQPHIDAADREIERRTAEQGHEFDSEYRDELVLLLAAHRIRSTRIDEREVTSQNVGGDSASYAGAYGRGLQSTAPGQELARVSPTGFFGGATYTVTRPDIEDDEDEEG